MKRILEIGGLIAGCFVVLGLVLGLGAYAGTATTKTVINSGYYSESATGTNTVALTVTPGESFALHHVGMKSDQSNTGSLTVSVDSGLGAAYDYTLHTEAMTNAVNKIVQFNPPLYFGPADKINIDWQPTNTATIWSSVLVWSDHY